MIKCESCGASFDELEPVCPYCGTLNYIGASQEYYQKLDKIKDDLEDIPDQQKELYIDVAKDTGKKTMKYIVIAIGIVCVLGACLYFMTQDRSSYDMADVLNWQLENYATLDELYEQGDYDSIVDFQYSLTESDYDKGYSLMDWEHYDFMNCYEAYYYVMIIKENDEITGEFIADLGFLLYRSLEIRFSLEQYTFSEEEYALLEIYYLEAYDYIVNDLGIPAEDIEVIYEESVDYEYFSLIPSYDYAESLGG